jgi:predicted ATPase
MVFLRMIRAKADRMGGGEFPFSLSAIASLDELAFDSPVTFFVGENGSGKSTLLEAIAVGMNLLAIGSEDVDADPSLAHVRTLADALVFSRSRGARNGFFLRAEDFFGFTKRIGRMMDEFEALDAGFAGTFAAGLGGAQKRMLADRYGENPDGRSHGETVLDVLGSRIVPGGLYLLDEPETPFSPIRQLAFLRIMKEAVAQDCQFIIATHSPLLMAFPGAVLLSFDRAPFGPIDYDDVEHVSLTRAFLSDPTSFLRRL